MRVERIENEHGSHIIPALNNRWTEAEQLEWKAAVIEHDTGVSVQVIPMGGGVSYGVTVGAVSTTLDFLDAWVYLTGVGVGARRAGGRQ